MCNHCLHMINIRLKYTDYVISKHTVRIADMTELCNLMKECQRETQSNIQTYTDTTKRMRQRIADAQEGLNKIFDKYSSANGLLYGRQL